MTYDFLSHTDSGLPSKIMKHLLTAEGFPTRFGESIGSAEDIRAISALKEKHYPERIRKQVAQVLKNQNAELTPIEAENLKKFESGAMTITTGHQLMVCGGTAFFEIKILSAIALAQESSRILRKPVVPVFWMATEDHDFEEIASFSVGGQKFTWNCPDSGGAVGRLSSRGLSEQLEKFLSSASLTSVQREFLQKRLEAYSSSNNLSQGTRKIVREWAAEFGVLVLDGDDAPLKSLASEIWEKELKGDLAEHLKKRTAELEELGYKAQVFPRDINLFELGSHSRDRILKQKELPAEAISPNALLRPVYQEFLLPNLAYVGGGGELAYWLQLGGVFDTLDIPMPRLYLRDSVLVCTQNIERVRKGLEVDWSDLIGSNKESLIKDQLNYLGLLNKETQAYASPIFDAVKQWEEKMLEAYPEMQAHTQATRVKMEKLATKTVEQRYRIQKRRNREFISALDRIFDAIYPQGVFWERTASYADLMGILGRDPKEFLVEKMSTIKAGTHVLIG
jgi:uncharacterized protein YllA (UPF0747 family)